MQTALAEARKHEIDSVHLVNEVADLSLAQLAEFAAALRVFGVDLVVLDLPELSETSLTRQAILDLLVRVRVQDRKRHRGACRLRAPSAHASVSPRIGRPRRSVDVGTAISLLDDGETVKATARRLDVPRSTLQRRLEEVGFVRAQG